MPVVLRLAARWCHLPSRNFEAASVVGEKHWMNMAVAAPARFETSSLSGRTRMMYELPPLMISPPCVSISAGIARYHALSVTLLVGFSAAVMVTCTPSGGGGVVGCPIFAA